MDREQFHLLLHDILANIHDTAVLEKHVASSVFPRLVHAGSRADNLRRFMIDGIEALKPKEKNPDLMTIYFSNIKVCYYMKDKKGFVYDSDGVYCGSFDFNDLKRLFVKIGASLKKIKGWNKNAKTKLSR